MEAQSTRSLAVSPEEAYLLSIMDSVWKQRCIAIAIDLKIPELICNSAEPSLSIEEIAAKSHCKSPEQLLGVMRLLVHCGIGQEVKDRHFAKSKSLELLRRDKGASVGHYFAYHASDEQFSALSTLGASVKEGKAAYVLKHGMTHYDYLFNLEKRYNEADMFKGSSEYKIGSDERRKEFAENYVHSQSYFTYLTTLPDQNDVNNVYQAYPWSNCSSIIDIGGGSGFFLSTVMKLPGCEHIKGYVMELPSEVDEAKRNVRNLGLEGRTIEFIKQDVTEPFSPEVKSVDVDTVVFKNFLIGHIQDKVTLTKILKSCRTLFKAGKEGKLAIIESFIPTDGVPINGVDTMSHCVHFINIFGERYTTKNEWVDILNSVCTELGYEVGPVRSTFPGGSIIFEFFYNAS